MFLSDFAQCLCSKFQPLFYICRLKQVSQDIHKIKTRFFSVWGSKLEKDEPAFRISKKRALKSDSGVPHFTAGP
jgi:hypothetical protein